MYQNINYFDPHVSRHFNSHMPLQVLDERLHIVGSVTKIQSKYIFNDISGVSTKFSLTTKKVYKIFGCYLEASHMFSWEDGHSFLIGQPIVLLRSEQQISPFNRSQFKQLANRDPFGATSNNDIIVQGSDLRSSF